MIDNFGVPKHSDLEPDYFLARGNGKSPQIAACTVRFAAGNRNEFQRVIPLLIGIMNAVQLAVDSNIDLM